MLVLCSRRILLKLSWIMPASYNVREATCQTKSPSHLAAALMIHSQSSHFDELKPYGQQDANMIFLLYRKRKSNPSMFP